MSRPADLSPRRAPQQQRARDTVDTIFEGMLEALARHEEGDPTVQAIADRAGVSVGSVYQYFPTKASLINALIRHHLRARMDELELALSLAQGLRGEEAAALLIDGLIGEKREKSRIEAALVRYFMRAGDVGSLTEMDERMLGLVERFLGGLGAEIRPVNLELAAFLISNTLRSAVLLSVIQRPERLSSAEFRAELIHLVVSYLRPAPRAGP